ncbi:hypothetical protein H2204_009333 [Knufia peltigerae]|uniref:Ricin B lectin domain-containing protein n=1 Tax=Knufia peltigerae TaxID=1002370 RepID=A0AA39CV96_9EURO|nr:hypothetical protein H2204_009333 [Knufia peltigerae]
MSNLFDSNSYYLLSSDRYPKGVYLNDGGHNPEDIPAALFLDSKGVSSQNWQVFFQEGVYFLRNYDYGAGYQLALKTAADSKPQLLPSSGDLTQQWNITVWPDGTRKLVNMAVGVFQYLGVSNNSAADIIPVMNTAEDGSHWTFDINSSAGEVSDAMASPMSSIAKATTTAAATSTARSATTPATATESSTTVAPVVASATSKYNSLSGGVIAGIVVGAVALIAFLVAAFLVCSRKRKRARARQHTSSTIPPTVEASKYSDIPSSDGHSMYTKQDQMSQHHHHQHAELVTDKKARTRTNVQGGAVEMA